MSTTTPTPLVVESSLLVVAPPVLDPPVVGSPAVDSPLLDGPAVEGPETPAVVTAPAEPQRPGYRDVFRLREFRAMFLAELSSYAGDQVAAVALAVLLFQRSGSPFLAALGYASAFLPWAVGGPFLAVLADRLPTRRVMVGCDLTRAGLIGLAALPGLPLFAIGGLILVAAFLAPPFESAASAVLPSVLQDSERYSVATSIQAIMNQSVTMIGFAGGGLLVALVTPRGALGIDAVSFAASAVLLRSGLQHRPAVLDEGDRGSLLSDTLEGLRVVAADRHRYGPLLIGVFGAAYMVVPEAIATALAHSLGYGAVVVGLIMGAYAAGSVAGAFLLVRFTSVATRRRWMWPMAMLGSLPLMAMLLRPGLPLMLGLLTLVGVCASYQLAARTAFAAAVPLESRGRAYGIAFTAMYCAQALAILLGGAAAQVFAPTTVVGGAAVIGAVCVLFLRRATDWRASSGQHRSRG